MINDIVLTAVVLLSLVFLALFYGDRLNLFGLTAERLFTAPYDLVVWFWGLTCEAVERVWQFSIDYRWWVAATVSGSAGLLLITTLMVTGLTEEAEADQTLQASFRTTGGVLDVEPKVEPAQDQHPLKEVPEGVEAVLDQADGINGFYLGNQRFPDTLPPRIPPLFQEPLRPQARLQLGVDSFLERQGRQLTDGRDLVEQALFSLPRDRWRLLTQAGFQIGREIPEDPQFLIDQLEAEVEVIPGDSIAASDLRIAKTSPRAASEGGLQIQIRITNLSPYTIQGLIVRERLPLSWKPTGVGQDGLYRDSTVTWLVRSIRSGDAATLQLAVTAQNEGSFQSYTEVSATAAVSSRSRITQIGPSREQDIPGLTEEALPPVEELPPLRLPDVKLTLIDPPITADVNQNSDVFFHVENQGNAPATGVVLRVTVPDELDHFDLIPGISPRRVTSVVRRLEVGEKRRMRLILNPNKAGMHKAVAELLLKENRLDMRRFEIDARLPLSP